MLSSILKSLGSGYISFEANIRLAEDTNPFLPFSGNSYPHIAELHRLILSSFISGEASLFFKFIFCSIFSSSLMVM